MKAITKKCTVSGKEFTITESDLDFYRKMEIISAEDYAKLKSREISDCIGLPTLCPEERQRRRLAFRNERNFYQRRCDLCKKIMISIYKKKTSFPVYCQNCWWSDNWDPKEFSLDFNFSRSFFGQFLELKEVVPILSLINNKPENSKYCNQTTGMKNSYLCCNAIWSEDCFYSKGLSKCRDCTDCLRVYGCELCYECIDCHGCYEGIFLQYSKNCRNCEYSYDCIGCADCFGCIGLRNKQYYILNKKYTKESYFKEISSIREKLSAVQIYEKFLKEKIKFPHKYSVITNCENCTGDSIYDSKNAVDCYDVVGGEDIKNCYDLRANSYRSHDISAIGNNVEYCYETISSGININNTLFADNCWDGVCNTTYASLCIHNTTDVFGCVSLRHDKYCILNKQYSKEEYFKLREKIIEHMKKTGEWGEFFPAKLSPFAYNETVANEYFPLNKEEIEKRGWKYREEKQSFKYDGPKYEIPAKIEDVSDEICEKILTCEATGKYYKIQKAELKFYRKMNLPIPRLCPDERHKRRMALRNPRKLFSRNCAECNCEIQTTFAPDRPEKVLCEKCYLQQVN